MNIEEIKRQLKIGNADHNLAIKECLKLLKDEAVAANDECLANELWCYEQINLIQTEYTGTYAYLKEAVKIEDGSLTDSESLKSREYEAAWNCLDRCDMEIGFLEENYCIKDEGIDAYHISEILADIQRLQPLFPYKLFFSREMSVKKQICSICREEVKVRHPCGHIPGKVYMGQLCTREITECKIIQMCIVTKPFDKYTMFKGPDVKYDFKALDYIVPHIRPYSKWSYTTEDRLLSDYRDIGRNDPCPCGSGMKFKKCLENDRDKHMEQHFKFNVDGL